MFERWDDPQAVEWAKNIKIRDNYICQICHKYGIPLNSHHLNSWDLFIEQRYDLDNGITLCVKHHEMFHHIFGKGRNTIFQYLQFKKTYELLNVVNKKLFND